MSQKLDDPIYPSPIKDTLNLPSPIKDDQTTSEVVDVDEELERMEKEEFEKRLSFVSICHKNHFSDNFVSREMLSCY